MTPMFKKGDCVSVLGEALYGEIIKPPAGWNRDYLVRLVYPLSELRTRVYRAYAEKYWRLRK